MGLENTEQVINRHFNKENYKILGDGDVYKCIRKFKNQPYQILYVDFNNEWMDRGFDIEKYQESFILNDFYKGSGYLQWNNYFIFLSDENKIKEYKQKKESIERDEIYSRKYIMSIDEFEDWLNKIEEVAVPVTDTIDESLSSRWINLLEKAELNCVYDQDVSFKEGIQSYLEDDVNAHNENDTRSSSNKYDQQVLSINKIDLNSYRDYPKQKEFDFAKINLIKGVNGSGKTSLLEAIELILCGNTYRNEDEKDANYSLSAVINENNKTIKFEAGNNQLYKSRDQFWYNVPYHHGSIKTHSNFKKYNFFNSDAAFEISNPRDHFDIKRAFEDIALGDEVNLIESRMRKFLDKFQSKKRRLERRIQEWENEINAEKEIIEKINASDDEPEKFYQEFLKECKRAEWYINENHERDQLLIEFDKHYLTSEEIINSVNESLTWLERLNQKNIKAEFDTYLEANESIKKLNDDIKDIDERLVGNREKLSLQKSILEKLKQLVEYYEFSFSDRIIGTNDNIRKLKKEVDKYSQIEELKDSIKFDLLENKSGSIIDYRNDLQKEIKELTQRKNETSSKIDKVQEGLEILEQLVTEIKTKGQNFIEQLPEAKECPLCHTKFEENVLASRINQAHKSFEQSDLLRTYLEEKNKLTKKISSLQKEDENLSKVIEILFVLQGEQDEDYKFEDFLKIVKNNPKKLSKVQESLNKFQNIKRELNENELSEDEFKSLRAALLNHELNVKSKDDLKKLQKEFSEKIISTKESISSDNKKKEELESEKRKVLNNLVKEEEPNESTLRERLKKLRTEINHLHELAEYLEFNETTDIEKISDRITRLHNLYKKVKDLFKDREQNKIRLSAANEKVQSLNEKIKKNKPRLNRARKAVSAIEDIFENENKRDFLKKFLDDNKSYIVDIFKLIHSPKEFVDLAFSDDSDNEILLDRRGIDGLESLSKISSGQRSALALSVFLALNQKLNNGPNLIMFDDPVTTIDDLNTLSFLDYLRELAINSNRQIFFATANEDLAYLFRKKFEFFDEDSFKEFELERQSIN